MDNEEFVDKLITSEISTQIEELNNLLLIYKKRVVSYPYDPINWLFYGFLLFKLEKYEVASDALNTALERDSKILETWLKEKNLLSKVEFIKKINRKYGEDIKKAESIIKIQSHKKLKLAEKIIKPPFQNLNIFTNTYDSFIEDLISFSNKTGIPLKYESEIKEYENLKLEIRNAENYLNKVSEKTQKILTSTQRIIDEINSINIYNQDDYENWERRGNIFKKYGELEKAQEAFDKANEIIDQKFIIWYNKGKEAFRKKCYDEALLDIDKSISIKKNEFKAWYLKGIILYNLKMYKESLETFTKISESNPNHTRVWSFKGEILSKLGQNKDAIVAYDKALSYEPVNAFVLFKKGNALYELGFFENAIDIYNRSLETNSENYKVWYNKGNALCRVSRYEDGLQAFKKSFDIKHEVTTLMRIIKCFNSLYQYDEALKAYEEAAELWTKISKHYSKKIDLKKEMNAYENLITIFIEKGHTFSRLNKPELANVEFNKAIEIYYSKASLYYDYRNFRKTIECCDEALNLNPNNIKILCKKSEALLKLHYSEKALEIVNEVLNICPEFEEALKVRNLIYIEHDVINILQEVSIHEAEKIKKDHKQVDNWYDEDNYVNKYGLYR